jgi:hypothetical protein
LGDGVRDHRHSRNQPAFSTVVSFRTTPSTARPSLRVEKQATIRAIAALAISHQIAPRRVLFLAESANPRRQQPSADRSVTPSVTAIDPRRQSNRLPLYHQAATTNGLVWACALNMAGIAATITEEEGKTALHAQALSEAARV